MRRGVVSEEWVASDREFREVEWTEPIKIDDYAAFIDFSMLILKHYPDGKVTDKYQPLFCPDCGTLRGAGNAFEIIAGEMHPDGRQNGCGTKIRIVESEPVAIACDEPDCNGEILWPPEKINWSPWDLPVQHAIRLGMDRDNGPRTLLRMRNDGRVRYQSKPGSKEIRIVVPVHTLMTN